MPLALVTGASSGIGKAYAEELSRRGYDLIAVGRQRDRLEALRSLGTKVEPLVADLATREGIGAVADMAASESLDLLVNNAGVAHYKPFAELPMEQAEELVFVKELAPTLITRAAVPGMIERGHGTIVNVAGMIAFSGPAAPGPFRAVYAGTLAHLVAWTQQLQAELAESGVQAQVVCPGVVATEFHTRQGLDLSAIPRMTPEEVVAASLRGIELGETVCAPGVEKAELLAAVFEADLAAFGGQSPTPASRYLTTF